MRSSKLRVLTCATLAVGTEVTDGQILDRNSAWISEKLVSAGLRVLEHRAVPDDHEEIEFALRALASRVDLLFVTGGLGPTSDDFTRILIAKVFAKPLEFDENSWEHIVSQLGARGIAAREIQKQQCYFPRGSRILKNTEGTANAFCFSDPPSGAPSLKVFALPGPPHEVKAVWDAHIESEMALLTPPELREKLKVLRCLGLGESSVAEIVEPLVAGSVLRVGYRAQAPYVEVKLWYNETNCSIAIERVNQIAFALQQWLVNRDDENAADALLEMAKSEKVQFDDFSTEGELSARVFSRIQEQGIRGHLCGLNLNTHIEGESLAQVSRVPTEVPADGPTEGVAGATGAGQTYIRLLPDVNLNIWKIHFSSKGKMRSPIIINPPFNYQIFSSRGKKFITEKVLLVVAELLNQK